MIDSGLIPPLVQRLSTDDFDVKKEAAWAISNATSGGTPGQIRYLVTQQCLPPLFALLDLTAPDRRIIQVALEGIEYILKVGEEQRNLSGVGTNEFATLFAECDGAEGRLEALRNDVVPDEVYDSASRILEVVVGHELVEW